MAKVVDPPAQKLAGKRTGGPVMRNRTKRTCPAAVNGTEIGADAKLVKESVDEFLARLTPDLDERSSRGRQNQRLSALAKGNQEVRLPRAQVRRDLHSGALEFDDFLDDPPACCAKVTVLRLLQWLPNIGLIKARRIVGCLPDAPPDVRICELTARDKYALSADVGRQMDVYRRSVYAA